MLAGSALLTGALFAGASTAAFKIRSKKEEEEEQQVEIVPVDIETGV